MKTPESHAQRHLTIFSTCISLDSFDNNALHTGNRSNTATPIYKIKIGGTDTSKATLIKNFNQLHKIPAGKYPRD